MVPKEDQVTFFVIHRAESVGVCTSNAWWRNEGMPYACNSAIPGC